MPYLFSPRLSCAPARAAAPTAAGLAIALAPVAIAAAAIATAMAPASSAAATGAAGAATGAEAAPAMRSERLANGLEVLVLPEPGREVAAVLMCYRVGSRDEEAGTTGYAHLFEHLMYTGTAAVPDWHATMTALGGKTRSQTATEWMVFASDVPRAAAARVIAIEADRMRGLTLDRAAVSRAVADIGNEEAARSAAPLAAADLADLLRPLAFPGHPHARPQKPRTMDPADPDRCRAFYTRHFGPDRALLVVAGGVDPDTVLAAARGTMGHFAPAGATRPPLPALTPLPPLAARRRVEARPGAPTIAVAYRVPRLGEPGFPAAKLVHALLAESTPILGAALADGGPGATWAGIDLDEATGLLTVGARLDPGADPATALDRLGAAVPLVLEASAPQIIATTRDRLRMTEAALTGTVGGRAAAAARDHLAAGAPAPADAAAELAALRASDVTRFAGDHLRADQAVSLILAPAPNSSPASAGAQHSGAPHSGATDPKKDPR